MDVLFEKRFRGFEDIALGGYVGGFLAGVLPSAEVKLRRPVPLERPLHVEEQEEGARELLDEDEVLARLRPSRVDVAVPAPVSLAEGAAASARSLQRSGVVNPFRGCFTCGDGRVEGDGLRIFAGPVPGRQVVAAPWTPDRAFADAAGEIQPEVVWSALDCPTIMAAVFASPPDAAERVVTRQLAVARRAPVRAGLPHVILAWLSGREARGLFAEGAILSGDGRLLAVARHGLAVASWGVPLGVKRWR